MVWIADVPKPDNTLRMLRYNLEDGKITEIGEAELYPHFEFEMEEDSTVNFNNFTEYRREGGEWILTAE